MLKLGRITLAAAALGALVAATPASAGSYNGDFLVRLQGTVVDPDASGSVAALPGNALSAPVGHIAGSDADVSTEVIPTLTLTYFLNKNIAAELFCCFAKFNADAKGSIAGLGEVADFWVFPPIVTLQYHFDAVNGFKPYLGAGIQYIHFFDEKSKYGKVSVDDAWGVALQAGFDYEIGNGLYLNADVKKVFIDTEVNWTSAGLKGDVDIDPWIFSIGLGYRFNLSDIFGSREAAAPLK